MYAFAACSVNGATVVYINGIETTKQQADSDTNLLRRILAQSFGSSDIQVIAAYNPTHLDGIGDELESISQAFSSPISDFDLDTMLMQIAPELTTRKLLLLGYSQGSFYANELYRYFVSHDVPPQSIAVYEVATPAAAVEGSGAYITSGNDSLINQVRVWDAEAGIPQPLPANAAIPPEPGDSVGPFGGHHFGSDYLTGAGKRIRSDITTALGKLNAPETDKPCFMPPSPSLSYRVQKMLFSLGDPSIAAIDYAKAETVSTVGSVMNNTNEIIHTAFSDAVFSIFPKPDANSAGAVFSVEKALYGSSLSESDYEALLKGQNPEEVVTAPVATQPTKTPDQDERSEPLQQPPMPQGTEQRAESSPEITQMPLTATTSAPVTVVVSAGFGGGGEPVAVNQVVSVPEQIQSGATSSQDQPPLVNVMQPEATATSPEQPTTTSTQTDQLSTTTARAAGATSPVVDNFDPGFSGWSNYADGWSTSVWSTSTADCYSGNCLSEDTFNRQYENIKKGISLTAGSFTLYFRNNGYTGVVGAGVCTDDTISECQAASQIGGESALLFPIFNSRRDNKWHYLYFAFRDGSTDKEYCGMVDDDKPEDCGWQSSSVVSGTTYADVLFFTSNGLNPSASFYWDELGTTTLPAR